MKMYFFHWPEGTARNKDKY